jgi:hypothetical protein
MNIQSFKSRRTTEALNSVHAYVEEAVKLTKKVKRADTLKLQIGDEPQPVDTTLERVIWRQPKSDSNVIPLTPAMNNVAVRVVGKNLTHEDDAKKLVVNVSELRLIGPDGRAYFEATSKAFREAAADGGFTADLKLIGDQPQVGMYDAVVITTKGETLVLQNACAIAKPIEKEAPKREIPATTADSGFRLVAMVPNMILPGDRRHISLVFSGGKPPETFMVTGLDNKKVKGFDFADRGLVHPVSDDLLVIDLFMRVPTVDVPTHFYLVTAPSASSPTDKLLFHVLPESKT